MSASKSVAPTPAPRTGAAATLVAVPGPVRDIGLLLTRVLLGVVLIAHGWEKLVTNGAGATGEFFDSVGVPAAQAAAVFAGVVELAGGILLVAGLLTQVVAALVVVVMFGAYLFVHQGAGIFATNGGWELVAVIALAATVFGLAGPGRYSLDALIVARRTAGRRTATA
ncbi:MULTISPECIES: DoxX family protein [unclassified Dietzia]|uniref:DoxX family protein n=1 Tax=unclassified Dietzia TaxID=2617939 RepID=UPI000D225D73|nr:MULTISPECIES: DoxX family protein [unclassified Dietzia]AVZ40904.1 hypothetical protein CT688_16990 [Dietzia sp. JS16-p6b]QGW26544.1 hypothetical protein GJR88_05388 [Dietzia sp. DQ12-45-1b]